MVQSVHTYNRYYVVKSMCRSPMVQSVSVGLTVVQSVSVGLTVVQSMSVCMTLVL